MASVVLPLQQWLFPKYVFNGAHLMAKKILILIGKLDSRDTFTIASSIVLIVLTFVLWMGDPAYMIKITREDGIVENLSALFYLLSFIFARPYLFLLEVARLALHSPTISM